MDWLSVKSGIRKEDIVKTGYVLKEQQAMNTLANRRFCVLSAMDASSVIGPVLTYHDGEDGDATGGELPVVGMTIVQATDDTLSLTTSSGLVLTMRSAAAAAEDATVAADEMREWSAAITSIPQPRLALFKQPSAIVGAQSAADALAQWLPSEQPTLELLYRASEHGWKTDSSRGKHDDFHRLCDDQGPTLTIIQDVQGYVFGGFTEVSWGGGGERKSPHAFLFALRCYAGVGPTRMDLQDPNGGDAVVQSERRGPCFGDGDLIVASDADKNGQVPIGVPMAARPSSSSSIGHTYVCPEGQDGSRFLTGAEPIGPGRVSPFLAAEVEVFRVRNSPELDAKAEGKLQEGAATSDPAVAIAAFEAGLALAGPLGGEQILRLYKAKQVVMNPSHGWAMNTEETWKSAKAAGVSWLHLTEEERQEVAADCPEGKDGHDDEEFDIETGEWEEF
jgi:hypothetical protein